MRTRSISYGRRTSVGPGLSVGPDNLSWLVTARCCDVLLYRACLLVTVVRRRDSQRSNVPAVWIHLVPARVLGVVGYVRRRQCAQIGIRDAARSPGWQPAFQREQTRDHDDGSTCRKHRCVPLGRTREDGTRSQLAEVREKRACRKLSKPCAQQGYPVAWSTVVLRDSRIRRLLPEHSRDSLRHERYALSFDEQQRVQIETDVAPDVGRHAT